MKSGRFLLLIFFLLTGYSVFSQTKANVRILEKETEIPVEGVSVYNTKGQLLGITNDRGEVQIVIQNFPLFLEKKGFATRYAYSIKALQPGMMQKMGGEIPMVTIRGGIKNEDSLLVLKDKNRPYFCQRDTTIYYHFNYSLSLPDLDWAESAQGFIAVNFKSIGAAPSSFNPYRYAYFIQFNYQNEDKEKILPPSKIMPVVLMFANDLMSGYGYPLWQKLTHSYLDENKRDWYLDKNKDGEKIFSGYSIDESSRLLEEIVFDRKDRLQRVTLYTPEEIQSVGALRIFNNFSKNNGINSYRTIYTYSNADSNRCLASIAHLSTFFDKGRTYYQMKFSANLVSKKPDQTCMVPVYYLAYNHEHPEQNGLGIWLLLQEGYNIKRDHWLAVQDRTQKRIQKEIQKMKQQQEKGQQLGNRNDTGTTQQD